MAELKMSLNVARDRLTVFGADNGGGTRAPPGVFNKTAVFLFFGIPSPGDLLCLDRFFLSLCGFGSRRSGCEGTLSTTSDEPLTVHQLLGGFLLRFSEAAALSCSLDPVGKTGSAVLGVFSVLML